MNIVFGRIVGDFNSYFTPDTNLSEETFKSSVNKNRSDSRTLVFLHAWVLSISQLIHRIPVYRQVCAHVYFYGRDSIQS